MALPRYFASLSIDPHFHINRLPRYAEPSASQQTVRSTYKERSVLRDPHKPLVLSPQVDTLGWGVIAWRSRDSVYTI
eukprot:5263031-Prorocentrum_lima.AAC.1